MIPRMVLRAMILVGLALGSASAQKVRDSSCVALDRAQRKKSEQMEQVNRLNEQGRAKKDECVALAGVAQDNCLEQLKPIRAQLQALQTKIKPIQDEIDKYKALCPETANDGCIITRPLYEAVAREACDSGTKPDMKRCEDALFNIAEINYQFDQRYNLAAREKYERDLATWNANDKRGVEPKPAVRSYTKGLASHLRYLKAMPDGSRRDVVLYRTAWMNESMGNAEEGFPFLREIVTRYPSSRQIVSTSVRIGEYFFARGNDDSAIVYFEKFDPNSSGDSKSLGTVPFHKGQAYQHRARYPQAVEAFVQAVERIDMGQTSGDYRQTAILSMGACFAEYPDPSRDAKKFFHGIGGRTYEDTVFFEMGRILRSRGKIPESREALGYLVRYFPKSAVADSAKRVLAADSLR